MCPSGTVGISKNPRVYGILQKTTETVEEKTVMTKKCSLVLRRGELEKRLLVKMLELYDISTPGTPMQLGTAPMGGRTMAAMLQMTGFRIRLSPPLIIYVKQVDTRCESSTKLDARNQIF
jgi:hypothetical protein